MDDFYDLPYDSRSRRLEPLPRSRSRSDPLTLPQSGSGSLLAMLGRVAGGYGHEHLEDDAIYAPELGDGGLLWPVQERLPASRDTWSSGDVTGDTHWPTFPLLPGHHPFHPPSAHSSHTLIPRSPPETTWHELLGVPRADDPNTDPAVERVPTSVDGWGPLLPLEDMPLYQRQHLPYDDIAQDVHARQQEAVAGLPPYFLVSIKNAGEQTQSLDDSNLPMMGEMQGGALVRHAYGHGDMHDPVNSIGMARGFAATELFRPRGYGKDVPGMQAAAIHYNESRLAALAFSQAHQLPRAPETLDYVSRFTTDWNNRTGHPQCYVPPIDPLYRGQIK